MLATARALMFEAKLLAIDEPRSAWTRSSRGAVRRHREGHRKGVPVLLVEQEVSQVVPDGRPQLRCAVAGADPRRGTGGSY